MPNLTELIDALLPQTQCTKCGYAGCRPYAQAIASGEADIDQCPPGGAAGIVKIAQLLGREPKPLNPAYGSEHVPRAAFIDENWCIGCALCLPACPVDAIVGARQRMHAVLLEHCTGCELCVDPCPVDCIEMVELAQLTARGASVVERSEEEAAAHARQRYRLHQARLHPEARSAPSAAESDHRAPSADSAHKQAALRAALQRARQGRARGS